MSRDHLAKLRTGPPVVLPSLLLCDFANLGAEIKAVEAAGARALHLDVMDGHFVPNITYGMTIVQAARQVTELPLDVHLMISDPGKYLCAFAEAGASTLTIHAEAVEDPRPLLEEIKDLKMGAGLAVNPPTSLESIADSLPLCDQVLAMSVMPGYGGQEFNPVALEKLKALRDQLPESVLLEVDGGVNLTTAAACGAAGAQLLVVGSGIFAHPPEQYGERMLELTELAAAG